MVRCAIAHLQHGDTLMVKLFIVLTFAVLCTACSGGVGADPQDAADEPLDGRSGIDHQDALTDEEAESESSGPSLVREQRIVAAAPACSSVELGLLDLDGGNVTDARTRFEAGATLAQDTGIDPYVQLGADLEAALVLSEADVSAQRTSAEALLGQCAADGFERL